MWSPTGRFTYRHQISTQIATQISLGVLDRSLLLLTTKSDYLGRSYRHGSEVLLDPVH